MTTLAEALAFGQGIERPFLCPSHEDTHASASVNIAMGVWFCFVCQSHGTINDHVPTVDEALSILTGKAQSRVYSEAWLDIFDAYQPSPYWAKRYGVPIAEQFRCGTHPVTGHPTYPLRGPDGRPRGVVQRQEGDPKYLYPAGVRISDTFFGLPITPKGVVVLVEGASDVMAIHYDGDMPKEWSVLGCYGSGVHAPQIDLLRDAAPRLIVTAFDADKAGYRAAALAAKSCSEIAPVITHDWAKQGVNDPGDLVFADRGEAMSALYRTVEAHPVRRRKKETASDRAGSHGAQQH
jgi:Toprim-like